jgi:hypothetical protein
VAFAKNNVVEWSSEDHNNALEALKDLKVVEGHWNSCVAYAIATTAVEIDEKLNATNPGKDDSDQT